MALVTYTDLFIGSTVLADLMSKKPSIPDWKKAVDEAATSGDSFMWAAELDEWQPMSFDLNTLVKKEKDDNHQYGWHEIDMEHPESEGDLVEEEIPFWARKAFFQHIEDDPPGEDGILHCFYKRSKNGKGNFGEFQDTSR